MLNSAVVKGGIPLNGTVEISGYKHSATLLLNAALLCHGESIFENLPALKDVFTLLGLANSLGCLVKRSTNSVTVDASDLSLLPINTENTSEIHSSLYLWPVLLSRLGKVQLFPIGGCKIGNRPICHVIDVLRKMGAQLKEDRNGTWLLAENGLKGALIDLQHCSPNEHSGRTKTAILGSVLAEGKTTIINPFPAQEIDDLNRFLQRAGASIIYGDQVIEISGKTRLSGVRFLITPDFIEWATIAVAVQVTGGVAHIIPRPSIKYFLPEVNLLNQIGLSTYEVDNGHNIVATDSLGCVNFTCPPIYSDLQPILSVLLTQANGISSIEDHVWPERTDHIIGLKRLGASITYEGDCFQIHGPSILKGTSLEARDLRSAAAQLIAAVGAEGESTITGLHHLNRGYSDLIYKLKKLGAQIKEVDG